MRHFSYCYESCLQLAPLILGPAGMHARAHTPTYSPTHPLPSPLPTPLSSPLTIVSGVEITSLSQPAVGLGGLGGRRRSTTPFRLGGRRRSTTPPFFLVICLKCTKTQLFATKASFVVSESHSFQFQIRESLASPPPPLSPLFLSLPLFL
jgi:hypothetical protein